MREIFNERIQVRLFMFSDNGSVKKSYHLQELLILSTAHQICEAFDMVLAVPQIEEYHRLKQLSSLKSDNVYSSKINHELTWAEGEPNNIYSSEHCVDR